MLSVIVQSVVMLSVIMLSVIMLSVTMLSVIMLSVTMLSVITLSVIMLSVTISKPFVPSVVMLSVMAPIYYIKEHAFKTQLYRRTSSLTLEKACQGQTCVASLTAASATKKNTLTLLITWLD
jgi:hypothetical protein